MSLKPDLGSLMRFITMRYRFVPEAYPSLGCLPASHKLPFAVNHSVLHMAKSLCKMASECESFDHGGPISEGVLKEATVKMLINTLKLADELGMSPDDFCQLIPELMKSK